MKHVTTLTPLDGSEGFTNAGSMIDAIKAHRAKLARQQALRDRIEERAAAEAVKTDPETKKWIWAAQIENAQLN